MIEGKDEKHLALTIQTQILYESHIICQTNFFMKNLLRIRMRQLPKPTPINQIFKDMKP
jgi:hypothetical protein